MPRKAKRPCRYRGCPELTESDSGYCTKHEKLMQSQYNKYGRTPEAKKRYGYKWQKTRAAFLKIYPLCEMCKRQGKYTLATEVHHIKAMVDGGTSEFENLMPLCKSCHSRITRSEINERRDKS